MGVKGAEDELDDDEEELEYEEDVDDGSRGGRAVSCRRRREVGRRVGVDDGVVDVG